MFCPLIYAGYNESLLVVNCLGSVRMQPPHQTRKRHSFLVSGHVAKAPSSSVTDQASMVVSGNWRVSEYKEMERRAVGADMRGCSAHHTRGESVSFRVTLSESIPVSSALKGIRELGELFHFLDEITSLPPAVREHLLGTISWLIMFLMNNSSKHGRDRAYASPTPKTSSAASPRPLTPPLGRATHNADLTSYYSCSYRLEYFIKRV